MSKLDKDQVLADFTAAYQQAHGKKPKVEEAKGWFSVDGGKNMRLAQLAELAASLSASKPSAKAPAIEKAAKAPAKKPSKAPAKAASQASGGGLSAKELWRQKLSNGASQGKLPRGF